MRIDGPAESVTGVERVHDAVIAVLLLVIGPGPREVDVFGARRIEPPHGAHVDAGQHGVAVLGATHEPARQTRIVERFEQHEPESFAARA